MVRKRLNNARVGVAPRTAIEDAILENIDGSKPLAEGITQVDPELRHEIIATAAYFIAEQRGFAPGHEEEDWYRAEAAVDRQLPRLLARD